MQTMCDMITAKVNSFNKNINYNGDKIYIKVVYVYIIISRHTIMIKVLGVIYILLAKYTAL